MRDYGFTYDFENFKRKIIDYVSDHFGDAYTVDETDCVKNNDTTYHGISLREKDSNIAPIIYLDELYQIYSNGESIQQIAESVIDHFRIYVNVPDLNLDEIDNYEAVKKRLGVKLLNRSLNSSYIEKKVYVEYMDLIIVFFLEYEDMSIGRGIIGVTPDMLSMWDIDTETLLRDATENMNKNYPVEFTSLVDLLIREYKYRFEDENNIQREDIKDIVEQLTSLSTYDRQLYVLTNESHNLGASTILYPDTLSKVGSALNTDFYLIPSSIHEIIIIPDNGNVNEEVMNNMIRTVNSEHLSPEEVLSDHLYRYHRVNRVLEPVHSMRA